MEVELKPISKKPGEKMGRVRLKMYRPNKARKREFLNQVTRKSGYNIVYVKILVEMFLQPIIDSIINEPEHFLISPSTVKANDKTVGKPIDSREPDIKLKKQFVNIVINSSLTIKV